MAVPSCFTLLSGTYSASQWLWTSPPVVEVPFVELGPAGSWYEIILLSVIKEHGAGRRREDIHSLSGSKPRSSFETLHSGGFQKSILTRSYF